MSKIVLKGSMYGSKSIKTYSNPDILYSKVGNNICQINDLRIKYNNEKKKLYIYHSYDSVDNNFNKIYSGRWYLVNFTPYLKTLNHKNKTFNTLLKNIEWQDFNTGKIQIKNVKIKIFFSESGFKKIIKYFNI
jgi:hypothetical protein